MLIFNPGWNNGQVYVSVLTSSQKANNMLGVKSRADDMQAEPLGYLLRAAAGAHRLQVDRALVDLAVTAPQFLILTLLLNEAGLSNADLARRTGHAMPTVSAIVQRLKAAGLIESRAHPANGRIRNLYLTEQGRDRREACSRRVEAIERQLESLATADGLGAVHGWLRKVALQSSL